MDNQETDKGVGEQAGASEAAGQEASSSKGSGARKEPFWRRRVGPGLIALIILGVVVLRGWFIEGVVVDGESMAPTIHSGARLLALKKEYTPEHPPKRGEIVTFLEPNTDSIAVKRVIAKPGEIVGIFGTEVFINRRRLTEPYAQGRRAHLLQVRVPEGSVWLMGDNRDNSTDSRRYGPVSLSAIRGEAVLELWPLPPSVFRPRSRN